MLALAEPYMARALCDTPNLGCAMLIAACAQRGIETRLIRGQTRWLRNMFLDDSEELWHLIQDLKDEASERLRITKYREDMKQQGVKAFQRELRELYDNVIDTRNPRDYFDARRIEQFGLITITFLSVYKHYIEDHDYKSLMIVDRYVDQILASDPQYVGFSLQTEFDSLSRTIRKRLKEQAGVPIIVGGSLTPFIDRRELSSLFEDEFFDYLVIGEGELALPALVEALEDKKSAEGIPNIFYQENHTVKGTEPEVVPGLDDLPFPDFAQFDLDFSLSPRRILPLLTGRGCGWGKCAFCSHHNLFGGKYRMLSVGKVVESIRYLQNKYDCTHFIFNDEDLPAARAKRIADAILKDQMGRVSIYSYARLTNGFNNADLLTGLRSAGFSAFSWGLESGSQRVLDLMNKGTRVSTAREILEKCSKAGICNLCFVMFGFPGEGKDDAQMTMGFLEECAEYIDGVSVSVFNIDTYSPIGRDPERWGVVIEENGRYTVQHGMPHEDAMISHRRFSVLSDLGLKRFTADRVRYVMPGHARRTLRFLCASHEMLSSSEVIEYIHDGEGGKVFPIILGEVRENDEHSLLFPINVRETLVMNKKRPEKEIVLGDFERELFLLSDGTRAIEDMIEAACNSLRNHKAEEALKERAMRFFRRVFAENHALGFRRSWAER